MALNACSVQVKGEGFGADKMYKDKDKLRRRPVTQLAIREKLSRRVSALALKPLDGPESHLRFISPAFL